MSASNVPGEHVHEASTARIEAVNVTSERLPLIDVLDRVLDKGIVIVYEIGISVIGLRAIEVTGRVIVASIETYLQKAGRLDAPDAQSDALTSAADEYLRGLGPH